MKFKLTIIPIFVFGILLSSLIFSPSILDLGLTPRLIFISVVLLICVFLLMVSKDRPIIKMDLILTSYTAYVIFNCVSVFWSNTPSESIFENARLIVSLFVFLMSYYAFKKDKDHFLKTLCKISIIIVFIEVVLVSIQLNQLSVINKEALYSVYGLNSHKNLLSSFLYIHLFFLVLGAFKFQRWWKYIAITCIVLNLAIIGLIQTKAVWIALAVSFLLFAGFFLYTKLKISFPLKWTLIISIILVNAFFMFIQPQIIKRGLSYNQSQIDPEKFSGKKELDNERLELWDKTYDMIKDHPLIGVGSGNWQIHFPNATLKGMYRAEDLNFTFQRPHNDILWTISETGFIGFNLLILFIISILLFLMKTIRVIHQSKYLPPIEPTLCIITIIGFFTAAFFDFPKERIEHLIWIHIVYAFAYYLIKEHHSLKNVFTVKISYLLFFFAIVILIYSLTTGIYRYKGEYYTRKMYDQKRINNNIGVIQESKKALSFAYTIDPTSLPIKWYTGNSYALLGNYVQAKKDFIDAYQLNPYNRNVLNDLASAYVNTNDIDIAKTYYLEACRISPRFDDPKLNLTALYFNQKEFEKADSCLKTLLHDSERRTKYQTMVNAFLRK